MARITVEDCLVKIPNRFQLVLAALAHDDRSAGVLAHGQYAASGDVGVLQQVECHEAVVWAGFGIVEDARELGEVGRPE